MAAGALEAPLQELTETELLPRPHIMIAAEALLLEVFMTQCCALAGGRCRPLVATEELRGLLAISAAEQCLYS